jgi:outer membrane protein assembly factor BamA
VLCFLLCSSLLPAQTAHKSAPKTLPPSALKLISIEVTGTKRYAPEQIIAASGLQVGQTVSDDDFKKASQQLGETGAFRDVTYAFKFSGEGAKLDLQVTDAGQLVPARFDNFVWLSDQELLQQVHARVPLFDGQLPMAGNLADQVSDALQALAIEHSVQGRADYLRFAPQEGPIEAFVFRIVGPNFRIRNVEFSGADASTLPTLQAAAHKLQGQEYLRSALQVQARLDLLPIYLQRGYLKAAFADAQPKIVQEDFREISVDVHFPVTPGLQYKVTEIQFSAASAFPQEKLRELIHQQLGQPADAVKLEDDLGSIKKLYGTRGYMMASVQAKPEMDDAQSTLKYRLEIHAGDVFKMGDLDIRGLDSRSTTRLIEAWKLRSGDPYDSSYYQRFLKETDQLLPEGPWKITFHETPDENDKTVDVTLRFDLQPR